MSTPVRWMFIEHHPVMKTDSTGRVFKVALTWNFNSGKKVRKSKIEIGSERSRLNEK